MNVTDALTSRYGSTSWQGGVVPLLRNGLLLDGRVVDVSVVDGVVTGVDAASGGDGGNGVGGVGGVDLSGHLLLPAPAEPHAHLDKALTWDGIACGYGDLMAAVSA